MKKDIKGFENLYTITEDGTVESKNRVVTFSDGRKRYYHQQVLVPKINKKGYLLVNLHDEKHALHSYFVHVLVAEAFLSKTKFNPDGSLMKGPRVIINHKDGNKQNNHVSNLEYCDDAYNNLHAWRTGLKTYTEKQRAILLQRNNPKEVYAIRNNVIIAKKSHSREMAEYLVNEGILSGSIETIARSIRACCAKEKKSYKNLYFQYV